MLPTKEEWDAWNQEEANKKKAAVKSPLADNQYGVKLSLEDFDQIAKPVQQDDSGDFMRGAKTAFKQVPQLGWGLVAGAGAAAESAFGEGGIASAVRQRGVEGYQEWGQDIAKDAKDTDEFSTAWEKTKAGDLGAIVDWAQHGLGYAAGQGIQLLATGGLGGAVAKGVGTGAVKAVAGRMIAKETAKLAAQQAGKKIARDELEKIALKNVASRIGQAAAVGAQAYGMEGGEIFGELASETDGVLTAEEIAKGGLATLAAGTLEFIADKVSLGVMKGSSKVFGKKSAEALKDETKKAFLSRLAAQVGKGVATDAPTEFGTEYGQTLIEKWGAGGDPSTSEAHQEAFNAAMQGAIGGAAYGTAGGAINTVFGEETQAATVDETTPQIENPPGPRPTRLSALNQIEEEIFQLQSSERDPATGRPAPKNADHYAQLDDLERRRQTLLESLTPEESADHTMSVVNKEVNQLRSELGLPVSSTMAEDESVSSAPGATRSRTLLPDEMQTTQSRPQAPYGTISEDEGVGTQMVEKVAGQAPQTAQSRLTEVEQKIANLNSVPETARSPKMQENLQRLEEEKTNLERVLFEQPGSVSPAGQQTPNILYAEEEGIGGVGQTPASTNPQEISNKLADKEVSADLPSAGTVTAPLGEASQKQPWEMTREGQETASFEEMVSAAAKWQGAHINAEKALSDIGDKKGAFQVTRTSGKSYLDDWLMKRFGIDRATAHDISNYITAQNIAPDKTANLQEYAGEEWADKALVQKGQVVAPKSANKIEFNPDDLDREKVIRGYSHTSRDPSGVAKMEQQSYVEFMEELRDDMLKDLPEGKEDILNAELQRVKDAYLKRRYSVLNVRGNTVSSMIAGKSKFNFKQAESRNNALDKAEKNFDDWLKQVKQDVAKKTGVADVRAKRKTDETIRKQQAVEATRKKEKEVKAEQNKLPIINYPGERTKTITSEEWNKTSKDYKSILVSDDGTYRYRSMMREGGLFPVFLSDKKEIRPKILTSSSVADQELAKTSPDYSDPRLKRKEFRDVISGYTDSITTAGKNPTSFIDLGAEGTQVIRHGSVHPPLIQKAIATAGSVKDLRNAVRKAANGDKLGTRQAEAVKLVLDQMQEEVNLVREGEVRNVRGKQTELRSRRDAFQETAQPAIGEELEATRNSGENAQAEQISDDFYIPPAEEANEYPVEWDAETKTLADLYAEARKYDNEAADSLLESQAEDSEIASQLWEIIQDGRKGEGSSQVVQGEGFSLKGEAQKRQAREEEQLGLSGIKAAKPEFGKRPDLDKGRENVERLPLADEIAEKKADAAQQDLFGVADQNPASVTDKEGRVAPVSDKIKPDAPISRTAHDVSVDDTIYLQDDYENKRHPVNFRGWVDNDTAMVIYNGWQMSFDRERLFKNDLASNDVASASDKGKSSHARTDGNTDKALFSLAPKSWYFSPLSRAVNSIDSKSMPGKDWLNRLKKMPGVKAEELQWTGLPEYLEMQQGKVRKEDVLAFLDQNGVQVQEVTRGDRGRYSIEELTLNEDQTSKAMWVIDAPGQTFQILKRKYSTVEAAKQYIAETKERDDVDIFPTKFSEYTLPGGKNNREILLTLPVVMTERGRLTKKQERRLEELAAKSQKTQDEYIEYKKLLAIDNQDFAEGKNTVAEEPFTSSHWDEPNVLAHIRLNEREVNGEKVLFVEEIQSDWNIEGRKKGFRGQGDIESQLKAAQKELSQAEQAYDEWFRSIPSSEAANMPVSQIQARPEAQRVATAKGEVTRLQRTDAIPAAPFVQSNAWQALTLKRVLRLAAEEGFDRVSWVNGEQTAERYSLDKKLKSIWYRKNGDGTYNVEAFAMEDGNSVVRDSGVSIDRVEELLGKEIAKRISEGVGEKRPSGEISLSGDDLKIEAQWARNLYDKAVPNFMNQFGKKYGVAVENIDMNPNPKPGSKETMQIGSQQSIAITDEMRSELMKEGAPLFSQAETTNSKLKEDVDRLKNRVETLKAKFTKQEVESEVKRLTSKWKNAPKITVIESVDELPGDIKDQALSMPDGDKVQGVFIPGPNEIFIISSNMPSMERIGEIVVHEAIGHHGIESIVDPKGFNNILLQISLVRQEELKKVAESYGFSLTSKEERLSAAKEVLARMAERGESNGFVRRTIALIKDALRRLGFKLEYTDTDFKALIAKGRKFVEKGVTVSGKKAGLAQFAAAWHGTPHKFDRFSTEFVGAGEGNQAYGWGLYFASAKEVAEHYRDTLARELRYQGRKVDRESSRNTRASAAWAVHLARGDKELAKRAGLASPEKIDAIDPKKLKAISSLYQVELAPKEDEYLLWDKPLSEQSEKVKAALERVIAEYTKSQRYKDDVFLAAPNKNGGVEYKADGRVVYSELALSRGQKAASEYLHSLGIRGIKYLDGTSRGKGEGDFNYVIFDDNDVEIKAQFSRPTADIISEKFDTPQAHSWTSAIKGAFDTSKWTKDQAKKYLDDARTKVLDRLHPVEQLGQKAYRLHRMLGNTHAVLATFLQHGKLQWKQGALSVATKDKGFLPWLHALGDDGQKLFYWMAAKRAEVLDREGRENWLDKDARNRIYDEAVFNDLTPAQRREKEQRFETLNKEFQEFNQNIIRIAKESGLISDEQIDSWTKDYYLPFYRLLENESTHDEFLQGPRKAKQHISAQIKRLKGGEEKLGNPVENVLRNWSHLIQESQRNVARSEAATVSVDMGIGRIVPKSEMVNILGSTKTTRWGVQRDGTTRVERYFDDKDIADGFANMRSQETGKAYSVQERVDTNVRFGTPKDHQIISYQKNGETTYLRVEDPDLFEALAEVNAKAFDSKALKLMSGAKRLLTAGATFTPAFRVANLLRDSLHTAVVAKSFTPFIDSAKGVLKVWKQNPDYIELMASGGGFGQGWIDSGDPRAMARSIEKIIKGEGKESRWRILDSPRRMLEFWERVGHASEMAARVQLYTNLKEKGVTHMDAAFEARDLLDFHRTGSSNAVRVLAAITPFLNARFQGLDRLYRGAKNDPKGFMVKGALVAAASLALWAAFEDDDRYKELEDWEKWQYHHFWIGDQHFRIPKAFEVGALFSSMFESSADVLAGNEEAGYFIDFLKHTLTETFAVGMPAAFGPSIEIYANKSAFTGRAIEGMAISRLPAGERANPWTSEMLKDFGKLTGVSPIKAEHILRGHTAAFGAMFLATGDFLWRNVKDTPPSPAPRIDDVPLLGRFVRSPEGRTKYATRYYDFARELSETVAAINNYKALGDVKAAQHLATENKDTLQYKRFVNLTNRQLAGLRKQEKAIWASENLGSSEKRDKLNSIKRKQNEIYKNVYEKIYNDNR